MFKNYLKIAYRSLIRDRFFSVLNLFGLTTGITAFILIALFVRAELSYDKFHTKVDRIWAMEMVFSLPEGIQAVDEFNYLGGLTFHEHIPDIERLVQFADEGSAVFGIGDQVFYEDSWYYTNDDFFEVFDFPVLKGVPQLGTDKSIVLTKSIADAYFGDEDPIGKVIQYEKTTDLVVTAVVADPPPNSYLQFKMLVSDKSKVEEIEKRLQPNGNDWGKIAHTYLLLAEGTDIEQLKGKMMAVAEEHFTSRYHRKDNGELRFEPHLRPFEDIHLHSGYTRGVSPTGDIGYVYLFTTIALLILVIACINYINLSTARSLKRSKETGLRKVLGATRREIMVQYLSESVVLTTISVFLAFAIAERLLPAYNEMIGRELSLSYQSADFIFVLVGVNLLVSLLAGAYPAFKLSAYKPTDAVNGGKAPKGKKHVRRVLVVVQFMIAQLLIVATIVIQSQLRYLQTKDLGYNKEHVLFVETHEELAEDAEVFRQEINSIPGVESMAYSEGRFTYAAITFFPLKDVEGNEDADPSETVFADVFIGEAGFANVMGMELIAGRALSDSLATDEKGAMLINETAVKQFGWDEPLGKRMDIWGEKREIVGIVKDFHNESLKAKINPSFIIMSKTGTTFVNIRIAPTEVAATVDRIESAWNATVEGRPLEFTFYDEHFNQHYKSERQLGEIFFTFSSLAIGISLLGLVGLTAFNAEQRLKEIGIRKVLGASVRKLIILLSSEFIWLCAIAFVITTPVTYYLMQDWLEAFKYRINVDAVIYLIALVASLGVGWAVVAFQSVKVARTNPAEVLRGE